MADDDPVENFIHNLARINRYQRMLDAETQREMDNLQQRLMNQVQAGQIASQRLAQLQMQTSINSLVPIVSPQFPAIQQDIPISATLKEVPLDAPNVTSVNRTSQNSVQQLNRMPQPANGVVPYNQGLPTKYRPYMQHTTPVTSSNAQFSQGSGVSMYRPVSTPYNQYSRNLTGAQYDTVPNSNFVSHNTNVTMTPYSSSAGVSNMTSYPPSNPVNSTHSFMSTGASSGLSHDYTSNDAYGLSSLPTSNPLMPNFSSSTQNSHNTSSTTPRPPSNPVNPTSSFVAQNNGSTATSSSRSHGHTSTSNDADKSSSMLTSNPPSLPSVNNPHDTSSTTPRPPSNPVNPSLSVAARNPGSIATSSSHGHASASKNAHESSSVSASNPPMSSSANNTGSSTPRPPSDPVNPTLSATARNPGSTATSSSRSHSHTPTPQNAHESSSISTPNPPISSSTNNPHGTSPTPTLASSSNSSSTQYLDTTQVRLLQQYFIWAKELVKNQPPGTHVPFLNTGVLVQKGQNNEVTFISSNGKVFTNRELLEKLAQSGPPNPEPNHVQRKPIQTSFINSYAPRSTISGQTQYFVPKRNAILPAAIQHTSTQVSSSNATAPIGVPQENSFPEFGPFVPQPTSGTQSSPQTIQVRPFVQHPVNTASRSEEPTSSSRSTPDSSVISKASSSPLTPRNANKKSLAADILRAFGKRTRNDDDSPLTGERDSKRQLLDRTTSAPVMPSQPTGQVSQGPTVDTRLSDLTTQSVESQLKEVLVAGAKAADQSPSAIPLPNTNQITEPAILHNLPRTELPSPVTGQSSVQLPVLLATPAESRPPQVPTTAAIPSQPAQSSLFLMSPSITNVHGGSPTGSIVSPKPSSTPMPVSSPALVTPESRSPQVPTTAAIPSQPARSSLSLMSPSITNVHGESPNDSIVSPEPSSTPMPVSSPALVTPTPSSSVTPAVNDPLFLPSSPSFPVIGPETELHDLDSEDEVIDLTVASEVEELKPLRGSSPARGSMVWVEIPPPPEYIQRWKARHVNKQILEESEDETEELGMYSNRSLSEEENVTSLPSYFGTQPDEVEVANESITRMRVMSCHWADCDVVLNSMAKLDEHIKTHYRANKWGPNRCRWQQCGRYFPSSGKLLHHLRSHVLSTLHCAYRDCRETFGSPQQLLQHNRKFHVNHVLKPSADPFIPQPIQLPDAPSQVPSYMMVSQPVIPSSISQARHVTLGPWVMKNLMPPANVVVGLKRYNKSREVGPSLRRNGPDAAVTNQYEFVASRSSRSCMPSRPAKVRDLGDLNSDQISKLASSGVMSLWKVPPTTATTDGVVEKQT